MYGALLVLVTAVVFVNGWTDAPNAITCVVSTGVLRYRPAVCLAAVCNLLGILVMGLLNASVADTISGLVELDAAGPEAAMAILCAAMAAIVLFAVGAWYFGIPTSESHALIAALTGAALASGVCVNLSAWSKVLWGLGISLALGFGMGWLVTRLAGGMLSKLGARAAEGLQVVSAAGMAFMHGAQDGQKFVAVYVMARCVSRGLPIATEGTLGQHLPLLLFSAVVMAAGTMVGGGRIIAHVGGRMVRLQKVQGACADLGGAFCLLAASLFGVPMSTTHTKTTAIMGAAMAAGNGSVDSGVIRGMFVAWLVTFPVCGAIGYVAAGLLLRLL